MYRRPVAFLPSMNQVEFTGGPSVDFVQILFGNGAFNRG
jgi:hypothetical protein